MGMGQAGANFTLQFEVSYPTTAITPAVSLPFDVSGRPLGLKFTTEAPLVPHNSTFAVEATIWYISLDQATEASVLAATSWDCEIALVEGVLGGTTQAGIDRHVPSLPCPQLPHHWYASRNC